MSTYERELRGILSADEATLETVTRSCSPREREDYYRILDAPFIVVRAAGSLGIADVVAVRGSISFLVEIKTRKSDRILFSRKKDKLQRKTELMRDTCERSRALPLFAFRRKSVRGDAWRMFALDVTELDGRSRLLHSRLPLIGKTKAGNYDLRWDEGMKLSSFIAYVASLIE